MTIQGKYKFIAAFLLALFSLSTLTGFACSVGLDMGYNAAHHSSERKNHCQSSTTVIKCSSFGFTYKAEKSDCCVTQVNDLMLLDKVTVGVFDFTKYTFLNIEYDHYNNLPELYLFIPGELVQFQFLRRSWIIDHINIRIKIQSFQV